MNPDLSFNDLVFRVDELEIELSTTKKELISKCNELQTLQESLRESREDADKALEEKDNETKKLSDEIKDLRAKLEFFQDQKDDHFKEIIYLRDKLDAVNDKLSKLAELENSVPLMVEDISSLNDKIEEKDKEIASKNETIQNFMASCAELKEAYEQLKEYHRKADSSMNHSYFDTSVEASRSPSGQNASIRDEHFESLADSLLPTYQREAEELKRKVEALEKDFEKKVSEEKFFKEKAQKYKSYLELMGNKIDDQKKELDAMEEETTKANEKFVNFQKDYNFMKINMELQKKNNQTLHRETEKLRSRNAELESILVNSENHSKQSDFSLLTTDSGCYSLDSLAPPIPARGPIAHARNTNMAPPPLPPRAEKAQLKPQIVSTKKTSPYEVIYLGGACSERSEAEIQPENPIKKPLTSTNLSSNLDNNINPIVNINKHFAVADEEGQFMASSSLISLENGRVLELNRRNTMLPPHLRTAYAPEFQDPDLRRQTVIVSNSPRKGKRDFRKVNSNSLVWFQRKSPKVRNIGSMSKKIDKKKKEFYAMEKEATKVNGELV